MQLDFGFPRAERPPRTRQPLKTASAGPKREQFELMGLDRLQQHTYFFAVFADRAAAESVDHIRRSYAARSGFAGRIADASRLHISLLCLCKQSAEPLAPNVEQAAVEAARFVRIGPFDITLDRVMAFGRAAERAETRRPIVLTMSNSSAVRVLHEHLHGVLERARVIGGKLRPFTPHMTMLYAAGDDVDEPAPPVSWTVREFHLIHSLHGKSQYRIVGSFPLRG